jgi:hypothetical protein
MITYKKISETKTEVYLEGRIVGIILFVTTNIIGYQYFPLDTKVGGGIFDTLKECKDSL